jgi:hypothetical protein
VPGAAVPAAAVTLEQYVDGLRAIGMRVCAGTERTYWVSSAERVVRRIPTFHVGRPGRDEVDHALRSTGGLLATWVTRPDPLSAANAWLYLCEDQNYELRCRAPAMQRNVRRAMRELTIDVVSPAQLLVEGIPAFCDTRQRSHLDDGTATGFRRYFDRWVDQPGRSCLGAWKDGRLAAFVTVVHVDDWAELGSFSMNSMLTHRPNDALMYVVLSRYLTTRRCRVVSYGLSSVETNTKAGGLHRFKTKVGFEPTPVHRAFAVHPALRPLATRATLTAASWMLNAAVSVRPRSRRLKKLEGMLASILGAAHVDSGLPVSVHTPSVVGDARRVRWGHP